MNNYSYDRDLEALLAAPTQQRARSVGSSRFITLTYVNLMGAVALFALLEYLVFAIVGRETIMNFLISTGGRVLGFGTLALCLGGPWIANQILQNSESRAAQYSVLAFYSVMYAILFVPILTIAQNFCEAPVISQAIGLTVSIFAALSAAVFVTRANFSFLRTGLVFMGIAALVLIVVALIFGFELGIWFSVAMIIFACGYILYDTSNLIHECGDGDDIVASIALFGSLMTLFFYILRLLIALNRR